MPRIDRAADVTFDWCTAGKHWSHVSEFHTYFRRDGTLARHSHCKACKMAATNEYRRSRRPAEDGRKYRMPLTSDQRSRKRKLNDAQRDAIRARVDEPAPVVAADYGVHRNTVYAIWRGA